MVSEYGCEYISSGLYNLLVLFHLLWRCKVEQVSAQEKTELNQKHSALASPARPGIFPVTTL